MQYLMQYLMPEPFYRVGWQGELPKGDGSEAQLKRNCRSHPDTFWKDGEKAMYVTLDEGGKGRVFVQLKVCLECK
jgi:hypothetical protein